MSIGNLKTQGGKGTNWPWQYKMLLGLDKIAASIVTGGKDYESEMVSILCPGPVPPVGPVLRLEVRVWDVTTGAFTSISYYEPGSIVADPADYTLCTKTYLDASDSAVLALILAELEAIQTGTAAALGQTTMTASVPVVIANDQSAVPVAATIAGPLGQDLEANSVSVVIASDQTGVERTPTMLRAVAGSTIAAGAFSVSFANVGTTTATVLNENLEPGETISFDAGAINNTLGAIVYQANATAILLIITLT